ncbi:MAG TPA: DUF362 domain-containing protein [Verrucomicrobiota bacterium]|jgi:uncharacterized protein (DUF362 family)|nr:DUF362 domain-containing protein [Verrucomicrobiota bacterium]
MASETTTATVTQPPASNVAICRGASDYTHPETIREMVRQAIQTLALPDHFICSGNHVVIKPNWVKEHDERHPGPDCWEHVITHPNIIEAVADWAASQLGASGRITICDAPQTDSSFANIRAYCRLDEMVERLQSKYPGLSIQLLDLRPEEWHAVDGITVSKTELPGDPLGSTHIHLDESSEFYQFSGLGKLYGASIDMEETNKRHSDGNHEYLLCRTPMDADVLINVPKMKTHKKVGITCALKNLVGINANKNWLPHHTEGTPDQGGDQFPADTAKARLEHFWMGAAKRWMKKYPFLARLFVPIKGAGRLVFGDTQNVVRSGNWHGNDTCWRMVLDINKCLFHYDGSAQLRSKPLRYLAILDGIIGGDGNGPMAPDPAPTGVIIAGTHPLAVDCVAARCMGLDWERIRMLQNAFSIRGLNFVPFQYEQITFQTAPGSSRSPLTSLDPIRYYRPHIGWVGGIEMPRDTHPS